MDLACCHGNRYDVIRALRVLTNNRVAKIFIVCLHNEISFFGIFHRFTNTLATKKTFRASLIVQISVKFFCFGQKSQPLIMQGKTPIIGP